MNKYKSNWVGYARVSSTDQHLDRQISALTKAGVNPKNIYKEKVSGATIKKRPRIRQLLKDINRTNVVVVLAIDRVARNYKDFKKIWAKIKAKGAKLVILNLKMSRKYGTDEIIGSIMNEFIINILAYQAQKERETIRARQRQGIALAKKKGKYKGKRATFHLDDPDVKDAISEYFNRDKNNYSTTDIARLHKMSRGELYHLKDEWLNRHHDYQTELKTQTNKPD